MGELDQVFTTAQETRIRDIFQKEITICGRAVRELTHTVERAIGVPESMLTIPGEPTTMQRWWRSSEYVYVTRKVGTDEGFSPDVRSERWMNARAFRREVADIGKTEKLQALESVRDMMIQSSPSKPFESDFEHYLRDFHFALDGLIEKTRKA